MPPSLREIRERRRHTNFVARNEELTLFRENLALELDDERRRFVLSVFGQGGVGKTTLLKVYRQLAIDEGCITAWSDQAREDLPEVINRLATELGASGSPFKSFREKYERFLNNRQQLEADPDFIEGFAGLAGDALSRTGLLFARRTPIAGAFLDDVDVDQVGSKGRDLAALLARKFKSNKSDIQLMRGPVEVLTPLFLEGLCALAETQPVALFFDEFERSSDLLDGWLRALLDCRHGDVPGNLLVVIAGRNKLERNAWASLDDLTMSISLEPFGEQVARNYLAGKGIHSEDVVDLILRLSGRLPLLLATLAAGKPSDVDDVGEASDTAVDRFLSWVEEPERKNLAIDAAAPRLINRDIVVELMNFSGASGEPEALFDWLVRMPFVIKRSDGWTYHDVVRQQMLRHARRRSPSRWQKLQECLAGSFVRRLDELGLEDKKVRQLDSTWQSLNLEHSYHRLCATELRVLPQAVSGFLDASRRQRQRLARRWADLVQEAGAVCECDALETWGIRLGELESEGLADELKVERLGWIIDGIHLSGHDQSVALKLRALTYFRLSHYQGVLEDINRVLALAPNLDYDQDDEVARALFSKGVALGALERHEDAIAVYGEVVTRYGDRDELSLHEQVAKALLNKGVRLGMIEQHEDEIAIFDEVVARYCDRDELSLTEQAAMALVNKGVRLGALERPENAIAIFDEVVARFGARDELSLTEQVAMALFKKGARLGALERHGDAIAIFDEVVSRYGARDELSLTEQVAMALLNKGVRLGALDRHEDAIAIFDELMTCYGNRDEVLLTDAVAMALFNKGMSLWGLERHEGAIAILEELVTRYGAYDEISLNERVAMALFNKGMMLRALGRHEGAIAILEELVTRYGACDDISLTERVAMALFNKGMISRALDRHEDAIAIFDELVTRCGDRDEVSLIEQVAYALFNKGMMLGTLDRHEDAIAIFDELVTRCGDRDEVSLIEQVAYALFNKGMMLGTLDRFEDAIAIFDELVTRCGDRDEISLNEQVAMTLFYKGATLWELDRHENAIVVYDELVTRFGDSDEPSITEWVAKALENKASVLSSLGDRVTPNSLEQQKIWKQAEEAFVVYSRRTSKPLLQSYNYACFLALRAQEKEALAALRSCLEAGTASVRHLLKDSDWDAFRSNREFVELLSS